MRIVLDTNVFVSALISPSGPPAMLYDAWRGGELDLITSQAQIEELAEVLKRDRLRRWIDLEEAEALIDHIGSCAVVAGDLRPVDLSPDPDDNVIIATAIAGDAEFLVTGDKSHLLHLGEVEGIRVLAPADAVRILRLRNQDESD